MESKTIFVLHEYGAPEHYNALIELGKQKNFNIEFIVFHPKRILKGFFHRDYKIFIKYFYFLLSLPFRKKEKIVLGIAPFSKLLLPLAIILKHHDVYYHTSYTCWDGSFAAHPSSSNELKKFWINFINKKTSHVFAVSKRTKDELINHGIVKPNKISIVNHSYNVLIRSGFQNKDNTYIFVGRLVHNKGIPELLSTFSEHPEIKLTIVGKGELENKVKEYAGKYNNIAYLGYIKGLKNLIPIYQQHSFLLMNSQKSERWEELFGISIIEGMASGCVPIATEHPGPSEIITSGINGFLFKEGQLEEIIQETINLTDGEYQVIRNEAIKRGNSFQSSLIASKWIKILD